MSMKKLKDDALLSRDQFVDHARSFYDTVVYFRKLKVD